ncbi:MAG: aspartate--tRNA(Asn) ligase [Candidatus Diapherotrites archaeon]|nr:aspartate--tRNA(Asn) ligase [Candidatus Diapherotrites archaeon]
MRTHYSAQLEPTMDGKLVKVAGWVNDIRILGKIAFINLRDREGYIQLTFPKSKVGELFDELKKVTKETVVSAEGIVKANKEAPRGIEIIPQSMKIISKAKAPLPMDFSGKINSELETRLNARFMDLRNPRVAAVFSIRDSLLTGVREFMDDNDFIEVHTPKIVATGAEGGATLFPVKYFNEKAYLSQSPQLFKQVLMATNFDRVYEIGPAFRAEKSDTTRHLSEFTSFDFEMAFIDSMEDVMSLMEQMIVSVVEHLNKNVSDELDLLGILLDPPKLPFKRITFDEARNLLERKSMDVGEDLDTESEKALGEIMAKRGYDFYFITEFHSDVRPFYIMERDDVHCHSFDLDYRGSELSSGGQREHRYEHLVRRMKKQNLNPKDFEFYLNAFKYGMPPHGGMGLGVERFVQKLLNLPNVREAVLFPRDRYRLVP